jgi:hypothetical protein
MGQTPSTEELSVSGSSDVEDEEGSTKSDSGEDSSRSTENDDEHIPSVTLESLSDEQLRSRLHGIQREDILAAAEEIGLPTELESCINVAKRTLELSPELSQLRFNLVPSRTTEDVFWEAVFSILHQKGTNAQHDLNGLPPKKLPQQALRRMESGNSSVVEELRHKLIRRNQEIARLHHELSEMKQRIARMEATFSKNVVKKTNTIPSCHKGKWMMDKDSIEFLEYPDELKSNLRDQKQKRLEQIRANMKFILDTDNVEDSNGFWDCCGQTSYNAQGCGK